MIRTQDLIDYVNRNFIDLEIMTDLHEEYNYEIVMRLERYDELRREGKMKRKIETKELVKLIKFRLTHDEDVEAKAEIIKRLRELEGLKRKE